MHLSRIRTFALTGAAFLALIAATTPTATAQGC
jgi:hypothetical protein